MIAYEALFFKQGEMGEFKHKLSTRVAKLLGKEYEERTVIAKEISKFYSERSKVVHGEMVRLPKEFIGRVEGYLRDSIKTIMEKPPEQDYNEFITRLDLN